MSLIRFHKAQADQHGGYATALAETRRGRKTSHWIWYIFPQLAGLGRSAVAEKYAIRDLAEACEYLRDPLLRARYEEITVAVSHQLARGLALENLMGSRIDALKLVSSLTFFRAAAQSVAADDASYEPLAQLCGTTLHQTEAAGYSRCSHTAKGISGDQP
jgi:uncharacterized protein (DUF1810 family)